MWPRGRRAPADTHTGSVAAPLIYPASPGIQLNSPGASSSSLPPQIAQIGGGTLQHSIADLRFQTSAVGALLVLFPTRHAAALGGRARRGDNDMHLWISHSGVDGRGKKSKYRYGRAA